MKSKDDHKSQARMIRMTNADWRAITGVAARYGLRTAQLVRKAIHRMVRDETLAAEIVAETID